MGGLLAVTTNPYSITGLTANTEYDIYIQADCGNGDVSGWVGPISFTTLCESFSTFPYLESFESITSGQPDCWSLEGTTTSASYHFKSFATGQTGRGMRFDSYSNSSGRTSELITPVMDASALTSLELNFQYKNPTGGNFEVLVSNDDGLTYTSLETGLTGQSAWASKNYDLTSYISSTMLVKFKGTSNYGPSGAYVYLDEVGIRAIPNCFAPTALAASNLTATSADFSWVTGGTGNVYNFEYGIPGFTPGTGTSSVINASTTIAANPNSLFTSGNANWPHVFTACLIADGNTTQTAQTVTINVTSLPSGGTNYQIYKTLAPGASPSQFFSSATPLTLGLNTLTVSAVTATPPFDRSVKFRFSNDQFEFDAISLNGVSVYGPNTSITGLTAETTYEAYVQEDCGATNNGLSSWTGPVSFTTGCNAVADFSENFDAATAIPNCFGTIVVGTSNTAVSFNAPTSGNNSIFLKKYQSPETATLLLPLVTTLGSNYRLKFSVMNLTTSGSGVMDVGTVDANGNFTSFQQITINSNQVYESQVIDFSSYTGTDVRVAITGLYNATASANVLLSQTLIDNVVWEQNPACVEPSALAVSNLTATSADFTWTAGYLGNVGVYNFEYGPSNYTQGSTAGTSSVVNASTTIAANPNSLFVGGSNTTWAHVQNLVISSDGVTSQAAQTYTINVTSLPTTGAKARLIKSDAGNNTVFTPAAVGQDLVLGPNTFTASAVTINRYVKIQFNNNAFEFDAISVNGTLVYNGANTTLTALTAETGYDVYVQADCGSVGTSAWVGPISFTTPCIPVAAPYIENFDGATFPACWSQATSDNGDWILNSGLTPSGTTGPSDDMTLGGNYMYIETSGSASGNTFELITPTIDLSALSSPQLRFYSHMYGATVGSLKVDVTNDNGATYTNVFTKSGDQGNQWNEELVVINLTGNVSFKITGIRGSSYTGDIAIDNFEVREGPSCNTPNSLSASNLTATSADFTWTAGGTESVFNFEYGPSNYTQGSTAGTSSVVNAITTIAANPNSLFIDNSASNATWSHVQNLVISSDGVTSQAAQTYTINVTSLPTTGAKARLIKSDAGNNAVFTPAAVGQDLVLGPNTFTASAVNFDRYVKIQFNNNAFEFDAISVNGTSVYNGYSTSITGLTAETDYDVYVQADCGSSLTSAWVGPFSFTTICSPVANITENFDAATAIPNCFGSIVVGTSNTGVVLNAPTSGNNSIYFKKVSIY
jgi:hypothetical protein